MADPEAAQLVVAKNWPSRAGKLQPEHREGFLQSLAQARRGVVVPIGRKSGGAAPLGGARRLGYHATGMRFRRVTLLVAIYLALDFTNPMMPGAVRLVGGSLETVPGCQARSGEAPAPAVTMVPCHLSLDLPQGEPTLRARRRVVSASPAHPGPLPRTDRAVQHPASSSDDD